MVEGRSRPAWAEIDLDALAHNVGVLVDQAAPAALCAVVKADGYGHGAVHVARAAIDAGAAALAVAFVDEGVELRDAGVTAPVLILSEPPADAAETVVAAGLTPTLSSPAGVASMALAARRLGVRTAVHVNVDTGMHRSGVALDALGTLTGQVDAEAALALEGVWTHLAVADGDSAEDASFTALQLERLTKALARLSARPRLVHAANTAGALAYPPARLDMVRCGIGIYGIDPRRARGGAPGGAPGAATTLVPVLSLRAKVSAVRELAQGERPSYGRLRALPERCVVATVPLGYADGVPRGLFGPGCAFLVGGRPCPLAGAVTMDQLMLDCGPAPGVLPGDDVTLIGRQGDAEVTATQWAGWLGTIGYEVLSRIGPRVPRVHLGGQGAFRPDGERP